MQKLSEVSEITIGQQYLTDDGVVVEAVEYDESKYHSDSTLFEGCKYCCLYEGCEFCPRIKSGHHKQLLLCIFGNDELVFFKKVE